MPPPKVAVVTGANRGIGRALCQALASTHQDKLVLYAVTRTGEPVNLKGVRDNVQIRYAKLNLLDKEEGKSLAARVKQDDGGCDVLINMAGIYHYESNISGPRRREVIDVNYRGSLEVCKAFLPVLNPNARIVNVASESGNLAQFRTDLQMRFRRSDNALDDVERLAYEYEAAAEKGEAVEEGWARKPYFVSKALQIAMTMALARERPSFLINACCLGWVRTELGNQAESAPKTLEDGARVPLHVGFGDIESVTGKWWANATISGTGSGQVKEW